jgi:hypothetical protein
VACQVTSLQTVSVNYTPAIVVELVDDMFKNIPLSILIYSSATNSFISAFSFYLVQLIVLATHHFYKITHDDAKP